MMENSKLLLFYTMFLLSVVSLSNAQRLGKMLSISSIATTEKEVRVEWKFSSHFGVNSLSGFVVSFTARPSNDSASQAEENDGIVFRSSQLSKEATALNLHFQMSRDFKICVTANEKTGTSIEECSDWLDWQAERSSKDNVDMQKAIAGIAAGCIFLIPCIVVVVFIIKKDKQMKLAMLYEELNTQHLNHGFEMQTERAPMSKAKPCQAQEEAAPEKGRAGAKREELQTLSVAVMVNQEQFHQPSQAQFTSVPIY